MDVVVNQCKIQVIMTTHNPTTLSFIPSHENIYIMKRHANGLAEIKGAIDFQSAFTYLTDKLVDVYKPMRVVICEGKDAEYYMFIQTYLLKHALIHSSKSLLLFKGTNSRRTVIHVVMSWNDNQVEYLNPFLGLVDRDKKIDEETLQNPFIHTLDRYTKEIYTHDPIIVFFSCDRNSNLGSKMWKKVDLPATTDLNAIFYESIEDARSLLQDIVNVVTEEFFQFRESILASPERQVDAQGKRFSGEFMSWIKYEVTRKAKNCANMTSNHDRSYLLQIQSWQQFTTNYSIQHFFSHNLENS